jgi:hypothetical protein
MLKASGFQDLESADRDAPLSNRGNLHAVTEVAEEHDRLAQRMDAGAAYYEWAQALLHSHRFRSARERRIWARHADGEGLASIARALGITYHDARDTVNSIKLASKQGSQSKESKCRPRPDREARKLKRLTFPVAVKLAALLTRWAKMPTPS